jgi:hypothetical protein
VHTVVDLGRKCLQLVTDCFDCRDSSFLEVADNSGCRRDLVRQLPHYIRDSFIARLKMEGRHKLQDLSTSLKNIEEDSNS